MRVQAKILGSILLIAASLTAREKTDVIVMSNGDRMTGEIKGLGGGVLKIDLNYVDGTVSVQWSKVVRVESRQLFIVQAQDGSIYTGTIASAAGQAEKIQVAEAAGTGALIDQNRVVRLEETGGAFLRRWSGDVDMGAVYSKGNSATQYSLGSSIEYQRERWGFQAGFSSNLSSNAGSETSTRNQVDLGGHRLLPWNNYFYGGLGSFLQSSVQSISLQTTAGGGIGRYFKNTNRARIAVLGGLAWRRTNYEPSAVSVATQEVGAGLIATDMRFFVFKKTNFSLQAYLIPAITDRGRLYFNTDASYYLKLFKNFSWTFSFYGNWDTRPPANFSSSDYGYSSGVKWTFGYR